MLALSEEKQQITSTERKEQDLLFQATLDTLVTSSVCLSHLERGPESRHVMV